MELWVIGLSMYEFQNLQRLDVKTNMIQGQAGVHFLKIAIGNSGTGIKSSEAL